MGIECEVIQAETDALVVDDGVVFDEPIDGVRRGNEMRFFLVACLQASVSIETMSRNLGLDTDTVRSELLAGIEAWNAAQRRSNEVDLVPHLSIAACRD